MAHRALGVSLALCLTALADSARSLNARGHALYEKKQLAKALELLEKA